MYFYWQFSRLIEMHIVLKSTYLYDLFAIFISLVYWNVFTNLLNIWIQNCFPGSILLELQLRRDQESCYILKFAQRGNLHSGKKSWVLVPRNWKPFQNKMSAVKCHFLLKTSSLPLFMLLGGLKMHSEVAEKKTASK